MLRKGQIKGVDKGDISQQSLSSPTCLEWLAKLNRKRGSTSCFSQRFCNTALPTVLDVRIDSVAKIVVMRDWGKADHKEQDRW